MDSSRKTFKLCSAAQILLMKLISVILAYKKNMKETKMQEFNIKHTAEKMTKTIVSEIYKSKQPKLIAFVIVTSELR
jgi:hypothetical protein